MDADDGDDGGGGGDGDCDGARGLDVDDGDADCWWTIWFLLGKTIICSYVDFSW